jgi:amidohydrolase
MDLHESWRSATRSKLPQAVELRHALHAHPRLSGAEEDTAKRLVDVIGVGDGHSVAGTGRLLWVSGDADAGGAVALRTELDALPVIEMTSVPWRSRNGAMHCCGHDVHMAAVSAVALAATEMDLPVPLAVLLQPREEGSNSGARDVVAQGALRGVDAVVAAHVQPQLPPRTIAATPGPVNAGTDEFSVVVHGRGGHSGYPQTVTDSILALASIVVALQQVSARRIDPVVGAVCMVTQVHAGTADNVVPSSARASGTLRTLRQADRVVAQSAIREIAAHVAAAHGCEGTEVQFAECEPPLHNDVDLALAVFPVLAEMGHRVSSEFRSFGADDFSFYGSAARSLMLFVGTGRATGGLHDSSYLPGDEYVGVLADALIAGYCAAAVTQH